MASHTPPLRPGRRVDRRADEALKLPPGPARDRALHQTRKASKRARYGADALAEVIKQAGRAARGYKRAQKYLGLHQDAVTAEQALAELGRDRRTSAADAFADGVLFAAQHRDAQADAVAVWRAIGTVGKA